MPPFIYWIYFDRVGQPERIYAKTFEEFKLALEKLILRTNEMTEWIQRVYK
jgi:hypothetical protein